MRAKVFCSFVKLFSLVFTGRWAALLLMATAQRKEEGRGGEALNRAFHPVCDRKAGRKWTQEWRRAAGKQEMSADGPGGARGEGGYQGGVSTGSGSA